MQIPGTFWNIAPDELLRSLDTTPEGLSDAEAQRRLATLGANRLRPRKRTGTLSLLLRQFRNPIVLLLLGAAVLSFFLHDPTDAVIILVIVGVSGALGFWQERGATRAVERLLEMVEIRASVLRDGTPREVPVEDVVPGDVVLLSGGAVVPADARLLSSRDLFVNEAALTGEPFPVEKAVGMLPADTALARRTNVVFLGTHVVSGEARAVVVRTGAATEFGEISRRLRPQPPETEFEHGVRRFGYFLLTVTIVLVVAIFGVNIALRRPLLESLLFSLALAVGLTPQLLPAIITVNLAHGARDMAGRRVIVKRLVSIEDFGSMDVLCADKTGTLTEGVLHVARTVDVDGHDSERVLFLAYLNASFETGYANPIDEAIRSHRTFDISEYRKLDEIPYDFRRKRLSVLVEHEGRALMVTKGAVGGVLDACSAVERAGGTSGIGAARAGVEALAGAFGREGFRVLAVACRDLGDRREIDRGDETGLTFVGLVAIADPPKTDAREAIDRLAGLGVGLKVLSGDNAAVVRHVALEVGFSETDLMIGPELRKIPDEELPTRLGPIEVFAEIEPDQKERIINALRKAGHVVGYLGDGINDAPALHAAEVGISVDSAVDVAKEAADIVLLDKDLDVLADGVAEGRRTFANTLKYVFMATSANFGNMFSMAGASLFLPFLPLLPKQILVGNLTTDFPEMTIAGDSVDPELVERPRRWDLGFIRRFMLAFGLLSSVFDYVTFGVLLLLLHAGTTEFRTGWFVESVVSAATIVLVIRTRRPFFRSRPGRLLRVATLLVVAAAVALPYSPLARPLGFTPLPASFLAALAGILVLYVVGAELVKRWFYGRVGEPRASGGSAGSAPDSAPPDRAFHEDASGPTPWPPLPPDGGPAPSADRSRGAGP